MSSFILTFFIIVKGSRSNVTKHESKITKLGFSDSVTITKNAEDCIYIIIILTEKKRLAPVLVSVA